MWALSWVPKSNSSGSVAIVWKHLKQMESVVPFEFCRRAKAMLEVLVKPGSFPIPETCI
jgi:hypothetical protein